MMRVLSWHKYAARDAEVEKPCPVGLGEKADGALRSLTRPASPTARAPEDKARAAVAACSRTPCARALPCGQNTTSPGQPTAAQDKAQIAEAVADANCTLSSDLAGVYFAVQASYEKQFVSANQQAPNAGIREYKAAFAKTLKTMPTLLQTTSAVPNLPRPPPTGHHGKHGAAKPSPSDS